MGILVQSSTTHSEAAAISSECVTLQRKLLFTDRSSEKRIDAEHVSMDESEEKRDALVVKLIQYRDAENRTQSTSLSTDGSSSKKAMISFKL